MQISFPFGNCLEQLMIASNLFILRYYPLNAFGKYFLRYNKTFYFKLHVVKMKEKITNQPTNQQNPIHMYEIGNPRKTALAQRLCLSIFWERLFVEEWRQLILLPNLPFLNQFFLSPSMTESTYVVNTKVVPVVPFVVPVSHSMLISWCLFFKLKRSKVDSCNSPVADLFIKG